MALYILAAVCAALFSPLEVQAAADVSAPAGRVAGLEQDVDGTTVNAFLGIPFAHPPVGERRFRRAERLEPWDGIYDATRKPNACVQPLDPSISDFGPDTPLSEDCLYLNVWQPTPLPTAAAVMVWIHGGGFTVGSSTEDLYDGRYLAGTEGVLVVSMNYRLRSLGFAYTGTDEAPGNMGLTDQLLALQWVKDNIASFGGDPSKVTIFGGSSGGISVGLHLLSPESRNVFNRAIMQSGTTLQQNFLLPTSDMSDSYKAFAASLGCPTEHGPTAMMACLKQQDAQTLVDRSPKIKPVIDGSFIPGDPRKALENGDFKHTDILIGFNTNEGMRFFIDYFFPEYSTDSVSRIDRQQFLENIKSTISGLNELVADAVAFQYTDWLRPDDSDMYRDALDTLKTDYTFLCPSFTTARAHTRVGRTAYMYEFAHRPSNSPYPDWAGVVHLDEIPFVFGKPLNAALGYTAEEAELSRRMMRHWANFARTGDPNKNRESVWSPFTETSRDYLVLDTNAPRMVTGQEATECAFWDNYVPSLMNMTEVAEPEPCQPAVEYTTPALWGHSLALALLLNVIKDVISFITSILAVL